MKERKLQCICEWQNSIEKLGTFKQEQSIPCLHFFLQKVNSKKNVISTHSLVPYTQAQFMSGGSPYNSRPAVFPGCCPSNWLFVWVECMCVSHGTSFLHTSFHPSWQVTEKCSHNVLTTVWEPSQQGPVVTENSRGTACVEVFMYTVYGSL